MHRKEKQDQNILYGCERLFFQGFYSHPNYYFRNKNKYCIISLATLMLVFHNNLHPQYTIKSFPKPDN